MIVPQDVALLKEVFQKAQTAYVLISSFPTYDSVASALALYFALTDAGKDVHISCPAPMRVEFSHLFGVDKISEKMGNRNLMVSFDYEENSVEKVSYTISDDGKKFNLIISPKTGGRSLDPANIEYSHTGAEADLVFMIGVSQFEDLAEFYENERGLYTSAYTVAISPYETTPFATLTLNTEGQSCIAEGMTALLKELGINPHDDVATNLLSAMEQATNRFQSLGMTAETFDLVAYLLRNGARRSTPTTMNPALNPHVSGSTPSFAEVLRARAQGQPVPVMPVQPMLVTQPAVADQPGMQNPNMIHQLQHEEQHIVQPTQPAPDEWTKPKIFTGKTMV